MLSWLLCSVGRHQWNRCVCLRCPAKRDRDHVIDGCSCSLCQRPQHNWEEHLEEVGWGAPSGFAHDASSGFFAAGSVYERTKRCRRPGCTAVEVIGREYGALNE